MYNAATYITELSYYVEDIARVVNTQNIEKQINYVIEEFIEHCCDGHFKSNDDKNRNDLKFNIDDNGSRSEFNLPHISKISSNSTYDNIEELRSIEETLEANFVNAENSLKQWKRDHYYEKNCRTENDIFKADRSTVSHHGKAMSFEYEYDDSSEKPIEDSSSTYELACQRIKENDMVRGGNHMPNKGLSRSSYNQNTSYSSAQEQKDSCSTFLRNNKQVKNESFQGMKEHSNNDRLEKENIPNLTVAQAQEGPPNVRQNTNLPQNDNTSHDKMHTYLNMQHHQEHQLEDQLQDIPLDEAKYENSSLNQSFGSSNNAQEEDDYYNRQKQETERWQKYHFDQINQIRRQQEVAEEVKKVEKMQQYQAFQDNISQIYQQQHHYNQIPQRVCFHQNQQQLHCPNNQFNAYNNINNIESPPSSYYDSMDENIAFIRRNILLKWALQPPTYKNLKPIDQLLLSIDVAFSPTIISQPHEYFSKFKTLHHQDLVVDKNNNGSATNDKIKKAVRKIRSLLHPDRLPRDLTKEQVFLCGFIWDIISDSLEKYQQR